MTVGDMLQTSYSNQPSVYHLLNNENERTVPNLFDVGDQCIYLFLFII